MHGNPSICFAFTVIRVNFMICVSGHDIQTSFYRATPNYVPLKLAARLLLTALGLLSRPRAAALRELRAAPERTARVAALSRRPPFPSSLHFVVIANMSYLTYTDGDE